MGRPKKYTKTEPLSIRLPEDINGLIVATAKSLGISKTDLVTKVICRYALDSYAFAKLMAKRACADMYYWNSEAARIEHEKNLDGEGLEIQQK